MPYKDTLGNWTIGIGRNLDNLFLDDEERNNIMKDGITQQTSREWLEDDLNNAISDSFGYPWFLNLSENRKYVIVDMIFNMGLGRFDKFKKMRSALAKSDYISAANELKNSKWFKQVKSRGEWAYNLMLEG